MTTRPIEESSVLKRLQERMRKATQAPSPPTSAVSSGRRLHPLGKTPLGGPTVDLRQSPGEPEPQGGFFDKLGKAFDIYERHVQAPFQGIVELGVSQFLPGDQAIEKRFSDYRDAGLPAWESLSAAHQEVAEDYPTWFRWTEDIVLDPLNFIPGLGLVKAPALFARGAAKAKIAARINEKALKAAKARNVRIPALLTAESDEFVLRRTSDGSIINKFGSEARATTVFTKMVNLAKPIKGEVPEPRLNITTSSSKLVEAINIPRALKANFDLSASLRQGIFALPTHPKEWASSFRAQFRSFFSEKAAVAHEVAIELHPYRDLARKSNLAITTRVGKLTEREEAWIGGDALGRILEKIPGVGKQLANIPRSSERAYIVFINKLRMDMFSTLADDLMRQGKNLVTNKKDFDELALYINRLTGRGGLGLKELEDAAPLLNAVAFAPRYVSSRVTLPLSILTSTPTVRKMVARDAAIFFGTGMKLMSLLNMSGQVDVETDPRSSDFGKVRAGKVRWDIWAGEQQVMRFLAQMISGETKTARSGRILDTKQKDVLGRFILSKLAPVPSSLVAEVRGRNFIGQKLEYTPEGLGLRAQELLLPLVVDDLLEALRVEGVGGFAKATPSFFGIGVTAFESLKDIRDSNSPGNNYDELTRAEKIAVDAQPAVVEELKRIQENEEDLDYRTVVRFQHDQWTVEKARAENSLAEVLNSPGGVKRDRIQTYFQERRVASRVLWDTLQTELLKGPPPTESLEWFREWYWSSEAPINPNSVVPDYDTRELQRLEILAMAERVGIDAERVKDFTPPDNPQVAQLLSEYREDTEALRPFWDVNQKVADRFGSVVGEQYRKWKTRDRATQTVEARRNPIFRRIDRVADREKDFMLRQKPQLQALLEKWGFRAESQAATFRARS